MIRIESWGIEYNLMQIRYLWNEKLLTADFITKSCILKPYVKNAVKKCSQIIMIQIIHWYVIRLKLFTSLFS